MADAPFTRLDYFNVDSDAAAERKDFLVAHWKEVYKDIDVNYGIYNTTVAAPAAIFSQAAIESIDKWRTYTQLTKLLQAVAAGEDDTYLTEFLANYGVTRRVGGNATGVVRLVFAQDTSYAVGPSDVYTARNMQFHPASAYSIQPSNRVSYAENQLTLKARTDGTFSVDVPFYADQTGTDANLAAGVELTAVYGLAGLLSAVVVNSFIGGEDEETAQELVAKILNGITAPVLSTRASMSALLTRQVAFQPVYADSVIGAGDVEMTRDKHSVFPVSLGGRCDWYVRTSKTIQTKTITVKAKRVQDIDAASSRWSVRLTREQSAGVYFVESVSHHQLSDDIVPAAVKRDFTLNDLPYKPDIYFADEAAYSAYQEYVVEFVDTQMQRFSAVPDEEEYTVNVAYIPGIRELQDWVSDKNNISIYGDIVVKAVIPAIVSISFTTAYKQGQEPVDEYVLQSAAASAVRNIPLTNGLAASVLYDALQELLPSGAHIENLIMRAEIHLPDKTISEVDREFLRPQYLPYGTEKTIAFFCEPEDVAVSGKFAD